MTVQTTSTDSDNGRLPVSELLGERQGANSPFGDDLVFPLEETKYHHPRTAAPYSDLHA